MLALWTESTSATLVCTSPTRLTNGIRAGSSIVLGFSDNAALSSASDITAQLICSANGSIALTLGSGYDSTNYSPNSPIVNITEAQASAAMQACPSNSFHVQYVGSALLGGEVVKCGDTNINLAAAPKIVELLAVAAPPEVESLIPSLHLGEPSATPSSAAPTTDVPTQSPPAPTTNAPSPPPPPPTTTTTTPPVTSDPVVPTTTTGPVVPPVVPPVTTATSAHTTTSAKPTKSKGNGNGGGNDGSGGNGGSGGKGDKPAPSTPPTATGTGKTSDMKHETSSSSTSIGTIAGACAGVVGGVCAILAGLLVWRKRQQKKMKFDQFYDDSLAAASGFGSKPIYGREEPDEEQGSGPGVGAVVPLTQAHQRSLSTKTRPLQAGSPPPLVPVTPKPVYDNGYHYEDDQQDNYYNDQYHTYQPYELPYQQPYQQAYSQNPQEYYDYSYEMQPTDSQGANDVYEGKVPVSAAGAVGYYPQAEYGHEYEYENHTNPTQQHTTR
ncbi:hypothetical protein BG006_011032 [Podila minutissima]|uniref:Uncharacterized protein n=1 Tax=Podila minutissima TaxID=64525 RepID=A0A9P5SGF7_9FUNG|nr:hypothetical protein BG006_011032 [Podila minutissima]